MDSLEIIKKQMQTDGVDPAATLEFIKAGIKTGEVEIIRFSNSIFVLIYINEKEIVIHLFSQDSPTTLSRSIKNFEARVRKSKIKTVYGYAENKKLINLMSKLNLTPQPSNKEKYSWMLINECTV